MQVFFLKILFPFSFKERVVEATRISLLRQQERYRGRESKQKTKQTKEVKSFVKLAV